jgi:hypothetical protein
MATPTPETPTASPTPALSADLSEIRQLAEVRQPDRADFAPAADGMTLPFRDNCARTSSEPPAWTSRMGPWCGSVR